MCKMYPQSVQPFDHISQSFEMVTRKTPKMPPVVLRGDLYLTYVHSQMNPQT